MTEQRRRLDVVTIGEVLVDLVSSEAPHLLSAEAFIRAAGGAPANVAVAANRLGGHSAIIGAVGADPFGEFLRRTLEDDGVDMRALRTVPERTSLAFVAKNAGGIPDFVFYRGSDAVLEPRDIPAELVADATFLHASSMALLSEPSRSATLAAVEIAHHGSTLVSIDPNLRPSSWPSLDVARRTLAPFLREADVLKVNEDEARLLTDCTDLDEAVSRLAWEDILVVVTLGAEGCLWRRRNERGRVICPQVTVAETTGAGDAFIGALLVELARFGSPASVAAPLLEDALRFAGAAGALACTKTGAIPSLPTRDEVERLLATGQS